MKAEFSRWAQAAGTVARFVLFRAREAELNALNWRHFALGLLCVWLAGVGRHWDNPGAFAAQKWGVGSLGYVFFLALFLAASLSPLQPKRWGYGVALLGVCLTAPPAFLYAVPVEMWLDVAPSQRLNLAALTLVALWRVALWVWFLVRSGRLDVWRALVGTLFPLAALISVLGGGFGLGAALSDAMSGARDARSSPVETYAHTVVILCWLLVVPLGAAYVLFVRAARDEEKLPH